MCIYTVYTQFVVEVVEVTDAKMCTINTICITYLNITVSDLSDNGVISERALQETDEIV